MIITVTIDTNDRNTFYARNEDNSISIEYNEIDPNEISVDEIINDFLT